MSCATARAGVPRACEKTCEAETETAGSSHTGDYAAVDTTETGDDPGERDAAKDGAVRESLF